jgi:acyl-coenzyme A thioesterase PaaI-like protein
MAGADVAMWLAIMTQRGATEPWVTADLKSAFLRSARQESLNFTARVRKLGRRTAYGDVECVGEASGLVAHHVVTYARVQS